MQLILVLMLMTRLSGFSGPQELSLEQLHTYIALDYEHQQEVQAARQVPYDSPAISIKSRKELSCSIEEALYSRFAGGLPTAADAQFILLNIGQIDWKSYDTVSAGEAYVLTDWLYNVVLSSDAERLSVLNASTHLDGAMAEGFSGIVFKMYLDDPMRFVSLVSELEPDKAETVRYAFAFNCGFDAGLFFDTADKLYELYQDQTLDSTDREAAKELLKVLFNPW